MRILLNGYVIAFILCALSIAGRYAAPEWYAHSLQEEKNDPRSPLYVQRDNTTFDKIRFPATMYDRQLQLQKLPDTFYNHQDLESVLSERL